MSIQSISSATASGIYSNEIQNQKLQKEKVEQNVYSDGQADKTAEGVSSAGTKVTTDGGVTVETSAHGDTAEISEQGMMKAKSMTSSADTAKAQQSAAAGKKSSGSPVTEIASTSDSDDSEGTADLSQYSEMELQQMLSKGTISAAEYLAEMSRRQILRNSAESDGDKDQGEQNEPLNDGLQNE